MYESICEVMRVIFVFFREPSSSPTCHRRFLRRGRNFLSVSGGFVRPEAFVLSVLLHKRCQMVSLVLTNHQKITGYPSLSFSFTKCYVWVFCEVVGVKLK